MCKIHVPEYRDLPINPDAPKGSAWGLFDKDGKRDVFGTLNFITPEAVVAAKEEIQTGESVVLPLHLPYVPCGGDIRIKTEHKIFKKNFGMYCLDDELRFNTQSSSQWDGLLHFAHQTRQEYYNGVKYEDVAVTRTDLTLGIQALSERGGIVARGILLDFVRYAERKGIEYSAVTNYAISLEQLKEIIEEEKVTIRQGDILIVRSGLSKWIRASTPENGDPWVGNKHIGVNPTAELLEWIWNNNFAAVAGDAVAFEACPAPDGSFMKLHEACLPGWGMPIGELLDLEALSELAVKNKRWSFFVTVCPLNVEGGVASLANTLAIF
ncbi:hypothetical protein K432DRAFT_301852 [Lepidopterella palustris CBS 459.81]|uniref:Cyclase n=1 Tax=Lepidopterella palustris CBS 459.81 TaxID=1314670 RepID=A0A8E2E7B2_9PEZI|nr:hypothetical protein K432DRAFT_301852 [Lepidopterella palustris CBS 459.81]